MPDLLDLISENEMRERQRSIKAALADKPKQYPPKGYCHYCDHPVSAKQSFCDADCAADIEKYTK